MSKIILSLSLFVWSASGFAASRGVVVLVPGTGNSMAPGAIQKDPISKELRANPYFSKDIIQIFQNRNYDVFVVKDLAPAGKFESNGIKSLLLLSLWYKNLYPKFDVPITLVGHSAGGFYALYMAHLNRDLPIRNVVLLSAGLRGLRIAEKLFPGESEEPQINIPGIGFYIDIRGLPQFKIENVKKFIAKIRLPADLRIFSIGGSQPISKSITEISQATVLSPILKFTAGLIGEESDGIVESRSAYAKGVVFQTLAGGFLEATPVPNLHMKLEHPEQVLDYRIFGILGTRNIDYIRSTQRLLYSGIADVIETR